MERSVVLVSLLLLQVVVAHSILDILVSGKEMQRLLFGSRDDIKLVENGTVSKLVENNLSESFPPIRPHYTELQLRFASEKRLYYQMNLTSSDQTIMSMPTVTIPYHGRLQQQWIVFKIRFPCTKKKSGIVDLGIVVDFFMDDKRTQHYKRVNLSMKRQCEAEPKTTPVTSGCRKRCDLRNFQRKFCLSNFVARVKITKEAENNDADPYYLAHVPRKRIFKKPRFLEMVKKNQIIKARGTSLTCDCKPLELHKKYLVFGREDEYSKTLFLDNYSIAFEIDTKDPDAIALVRDFRNSYRSINCPFKLLRYFGRNYRKGII